MTSRHAFFIFLCGLYLGLPFLILHRSIAPVFWRWSHFYLVIVAIYAGFVALCTGLALVVRKTGFGYCVFLMAVYGIALLLVDFVIGSRHYAAQGSRTVDHPVYHHQPRAGTHHRALNDSAFLDRSYTMRVNAQRLRSPVPIPYEKPRGHVRILALGDSFTEGTGVNDEETFCALVQQQLNQPSGHGTTYEVLNAGVDSYVPLLERLYLTTTGIKFDPDLVVVFYDMSDLMQTKEYLAHAKFDGAGRLVRVPPPVDSWSRRLDRFLMARFYFLPMLYSSLGDDLVGDREETAAVITHATPELLQFTLTADQTPWAEEWRRVVDDIEAMQAFCQARRIGFAVVVYPWGHQVNDVEWDLGRTLFGVPVNYTAPTSVADMLIAELSHRGIEVLNLFPVFRNYRGDGRLYFRRDMHWNKVGHALAASQLTPFLQSLLERRAGADDLRGA